MLSSAHICLDLGPQLCICIVNERRATVHLMHVAPLPTSSPINVFQSLLEMCHSGALFFFSLAWLKVTNEGVWPMRSLNTHTMSLVSHSSPPELIIHVMISLISAASLTSRGRKRMCG